MFLFSNYTSQGCFQAHMKWYWKKRKKKDFFLKNNSSAGDEDSSLFFMLMWLPFPLPILPRLSPHFSSSTTTLMLLSQCLFPPSFMLLFSLGFQWIAKLQVPSMARWTTIYNSRPDLFPKIQTNTSYWIYPLCPSTQHAQHWTQMYYFPKVHFSLVLLSEAATGCSWLYSMYLLHSKTQVEGIAHI